MPVQINGVKYLIGTSFFLRSTDKPAFLNGELPVCDGCGGIIDRDYCIIITALIKAELLPKNYPYLCCGCRFKMELHHKSPDKDLET